MWSLNKTISGLAFVNPNMPALKYGRTMKEDSVTSFYHFMRKSHKEFKAVEFGLSLHKEFPFIGASHDIMLSCSCCLPAFLEAK